MIFHELSQDRQCLLRCLSGTLNLRRDDAASHGTLPTHEIMGFLRNLCPGCRMRWWYGAGGVLSTLRRPTDSYWAVDATSMNWWCLIKSEASNNRHVRRSHIFDPQLNYHSEFLLVVIGPLVTLWSRSSKCEGKRLATSGEYCRWFFFSSSPGRSWNQMQGGHFLGDLFWEKKTKLVGGLDNCLFSHILGIIIPID